MSETLRMEIQISSFLPLSEIGSNLSCNLSELQSLKSSSFHIFLFCFTNVFWLVSIVFMSVSTDVLSWKWPDSPTCFSLRHLNISLPSSSRWSNQNRKSWERWLQLAPIHLWHGHSDFQIGRVCRERLTFLEGKGQWGRMGWWLNLICMQMIWTLDIWPVIFQKYHRTWISSFCLKKTSNMARSENCGSFVKRRR